MTNKNKYNRKVFHPLAITIGLMLVFIFGNAFGTVSTGFADEASDAAAEPVVPIVGTRTTTNLLSSAECQMKLTEWGDPEFAKYQTYMENTFSNKSTTSSLLDLGMQRYDKFKTDVRTQMEVLIGRQVSLAAASEAGVASQFPGLSGCEQVARDYISNAGKLLQMRAITTSGIKKASAFVEKYQQINVKLRSLDLDMMKMVVNFSTFEQKLPCYLKSCV